MKLIGNKLTLEAGETVTVEAVATLVETPEPIEPQPEPPVDPTPTPPPTVEEITVIKQAQNAIAHEYNDPTKDFEKINTLVTDGCFLKAIKGGKKILLKNVGSAGAPHGGGVYFLILATNRVEYLQWDNSDYPDWWINGSSGTEPGRAPGEAAVRLMGDLGKAVISKVNFRCGKWVQSNGVRTWWKQGVQLRHLEEAEFYGCRFVGKMEVGRQKDPGGVNQRVKSVLFRGCGFTHLFDFSMKESVGKVEYKDCFYIDESGKPTGKKIPDQVMKGTWQP